MVKYGCIIENVCCVGTWQIWGVWGGGGARESIVEADDKVGECMWSPTGRLWVLRFCERLARDEDKSWGLEQFWVEGISEPREQWGF